MDEMRTAERLTTAALAILLDEGAQAVTMRRVAAQSGVSTMATYRHFPNREALLRSAVDAAVADLSKDWGNREPAADFETQTDRLLDDFLDFALGKPNLYTFLVTERRDGARRFPEDFRTGGSPAFAPMLSTVEKAMQDGDIRPDDPLEVTLALTSPIMGLVQQYHGGRISLSDSDFRQLCRRTVRRVLNGLRA